MTRSISPSMKLPITNSSFLENYVTSNITLSQKRLPTKNWCRRKRVPRCAGVPNPFFFLVSSTINRRNACNICSIDKDLIFRQRAKVKHTRNNVGIEILQKRHRRRHWQDRRYRAWARNRKEPVISGRRYVQRENRESDGEAHRAPRPARDADVDVDDVHAEGVFERHLRMEPCKATRGRG